MCLLLFSALVLFCKVSVYGQTELAPEHPKVRTSQEIFDGLVRAVGDGRSPPSLRLVPARDASRLVAAFSPPRHELALGERAYDVCIAQGADSLNALAFLLGHELAHYYRDHGVTQDFGQRYADLELGQTLQLFSAVQQVKQETEADHFGGFFGHLAGYRPLEVAPALLASIYKTFELEEDLERYPALAERQAIVQNAGQELRQLIPFFEAGQRLLALGQYGAAFRCFEYISRTFASREILNNAGVARALQGLDLANPVGPNFVYPFELDATTRLADHDKAANTGLLDDALRLRLLTEAAELFDRALRKDPSYATAYINQACVAVLLDEPEEALLWAKRAFKLAQKSGEPMSRAHALIARGIARFYADPADRDRAREDFAAALATAPDLAALNLAALEGSSKAAVGGESPFEILAERIDGRVPEAYNDYLSEARIVELAAGGANSTALAIYTYQGSDWEGLIIDTGYSTVALLATLADYGGTTGRGLAVGATRAQMAAAYGPPAYRVAGRQQSGHVYPDARLVVYTGPDDRIAGWMVYHIDQ